MIIKYIKYPIITFIIFNFLSNCATFKYKIDKNRNYLDDAKVYFKFGDYKKAFKSARVVYCSDYFSETQKEEALYLMNESAEQMVINLQDKIYVISDKELKKEIENIKKELGINIIFKKVGYEYIIYYDKSYYYKLKKLNPDSIYLKKMEYSYISRISRFVTDYVYRYKKIETIIKRYWKLYESHPEKKYIPMLLMRIADLYLYLYEQGPSVKKELGLSNSEIKEMYNKAREIYKLIKKKYPHSAVAHQIGYVIESVRLRKGPSSRAKIIKRIPAGTMVKIIDRSAKKVSISNMYDYWYKVKLINGLEGWVYGFYLRMRY